MGHERDGISLLFFILCSEYVKVQTWEGCVGKPPALSVVPELEAKVKRDTLSTVIWIT